MDHELFSTDSLRNFTNAVLSPSTTKVTLVAEGESIAICQVGNAH